jgi:selenocysteine lyase/cysteine desulfurase
MKGMTDIAADFDVPFIVDCASCLPFVGLDPRKTGADVMIYSMDKAGRAPICGLMIGKSEVMSVIRKGMGWDGPRTGGTSSYSKGVFSMHDPGRDSLVGLHAFLKTVLESPKKVTDPVDVMYQILMEELRDFAPKRFRNKLIATSSHHMGGLELNYAESWQGNELGLPLYNLEDLYTNTNAIDSLQWAKHPRPSMAATCLLARVWV